MESIFFRNQPQPWQPHQGSAFPQDKPQPDRLPSLTLSPKERQSYSLLRAIECARRGDWRDAGFEREITKEFLRREGAIDLNEPHALRVPACVLVNQRDLTVGTNSAGGHLVGSEIVSVLDAVRPRSVALRCGAQTLTGLKHNTSCTRGAGTATITWLANEGSAVTESGITLSQISLAPKTVSAYVETSHLLEALAPDLAEAMVRLDLTGALTVAVDVAVLNGSGTGGQPTGIMNAVGVGSFNGTSIAYADVLAGQRGVLANNGMGSSGEISFVCQPTIAELLAKRQAFSTLAPLWEGPLQEGKLTGCRALSTMNMPASRLLGCDFSQILLAEWGLGGVEVRGNPYANFQSGIRGYAALLSMDVALLTATCATVSSSVT